MTQETKIPVMITDDDCGIVVVATITGRSYDEVKQFWPGGFHGDISDSYIHHQGVLSRLGFRWKKRSLEDIFSGKAQSGKTAILIHAKDDPKTWIREDIILMHWVVLAIVTEDSVLVHWGKGEIKTFSKEAFAEHYKNPFCISYEVYRGETKKLPWYKRAYKRVTSFIGKIISR